MKKILFPRSNPNRVPFPVVSTLGPRSHPGNLDVPFPVADRLLLPSTSRPKKLKTLSEIIQEALDLIEEDEFCGGLLDEDNSMEGAD